MILSITSLTLTGCKNMIFVTIQFNCNVKRTYCSSVFAVKILVFTLSDSVQPFARVSVKM